ncbi:MAG: glycosyltransferase [Myxococcales bacterium]|jgi:glycosyltransferase involved in cell wall biosynthesis
MRILSLLSTSSVTGPAELCVSDAEALRDAGHEVLFGCDTKRPGNYVEAIRRAGFEVMDELVLCRKSSPMDLARDLSRLRRRMRGADVVHCRFSHDHTVALLAMKGMSRPPLLVRTAEIAPSLRPGFARGIAFRACDAVVVSCRQYAERLRVGHGVPAERIVVLPGRVDLRRFTPGDGAELRCELGVGEDDVLFGIVSRIKVERRHELLVRAFAQIAPAQPRAKLAIVGRGEHEPDLRELVASLGLTGRVLFAGYRTGDALVEVYRALDVKVWLAEGNDGTCRAVLEAMACGKPAIVGDHGAMSEIVRDGVDGRVVPLDGRALADALASMCDERRRAEAAAGARERASAFDLPVRAREIVGLYERLAQLRAYPLRSARA